MGLSRPVATAGFAAATAIGVVAFRRMHLRWGARPEESAAELPGDGLLPDARLVATRAIAIDAPRESVWPWLAQMGQGRGGLYSYDRLEKVFGCEIASADQIEAQWQDVRVGDEFRIHPKVALQVALVEPPRALVVRSPEARAGEPGAPYDFTWAFVLEAHEPGRCRLVVRERYAWAAPAVRAMVEPLAAVSFVMSERMLRGIRDRAEASSAG